MKGNISAPARGAARLRAVRAALVGLATFATMYTLPVATTTSSTFGGAKPVSSPTLVGSSIHTMNGPCGPVPCARYDYDAESPIKP